MSLTWIVGLACSGQIYPHQARLTALPDRGPRCGRWVWTASACEADEQKQDEASGKRASAELRLFQQRVPAGDPTRLSAVASPASRSDQQYVLIRPTEAFIAERTGLYPEIPEWREPSSGYAMGLPAFLDRTLCTVIMPRPDMVERIFSRNVWMIVSTADDREELVRAGLPRHRIVVLPLDD